MKEGSSRRLDRRACSVRDGDGAGVKLIEGARAPRLQRGGACVAPGSGILLDER